MAWFINRTGQPEGPLEDAQILQMIQSGQLTGANICPQGGNEWMPLQQHPPFGQALQAAGGGYAPAPGAPGATAVPATAPMGPGGVMPGQPGQSMPPGQASAAPPKKKKLGLIIGGVVGALVLVGVIVGLVMAFTGGADSELATKVPNDTELFFEVPSVPAAVKAFMEMDVIDAKDIDAEGKIKEAAEGLKDAFDIKKSEANGVVEGIKSIGVTVTSLTSNPKGAMVVSFGDEDAVSAWLKSSRFSKEGEFSGGERYSLKAVEFDESAKDWSAARKAFAFMSFPEKSDNIVVWFEDSAILAIGEKSVVEEIGSVLGGDHESLADTDEWKKARFEGDASALLFVDSGLLRKSDDEKLKDAAKDYFNEVAPFTGLMRFDPAGIVMSVHGEMKGNKIDADDAFGSSPSLDIFEKLPDQTVAYIAFSTKREGDGKEVKKRIIKQMKATDDDAAEKFEKGMEALKDEIGIKFEDILDAVGDEMVMALVADKDFVFDKEKKITDNIDSAAFAWLIEVGDEGKAKELVDVLRKKPFEKAPSLEELYEIKKKDNGFTATPTEKASKQGMPKIKVRIMDGHIVIVAGGDKMIDATLDALRGTKTLADDAAHKAAIKAVSNEAHLLSWFDAGRVAKVGLDFVESDERLKKQLEGAEKEAGIGVNVLRIKGDKRMTAAIAAKFESKGDTWTYDLSTLNAPAYGVLGGLTFLTRAFAPKPEVEMFIPNTGSSQCDRYLDTMQRCARKTNDTTMASTVKVINDTYRDTLKKTKSSFARRAIGKSCDKQRKSFADKHPECN